MFDNFDLFLIFLTGLAFGSFASVVSSRLPEKQPMFMARSKCPSCHRDLSAMSLIPLVSWLWQKGKCRYCRAGISFFYPLIELTMAGMFSLIYLKYGLGVKFFIFCGVSFTLVTIIAIDLKYKIIPDELQIVLLILAVIYQFFFPVSEFFGLDGMLAGAVLGFGLRWLFFKWKKREALGMGDVKFLMVSGLFLGAETMLPFIFISGVLGVISAMAWRTFRKEREFPFAPALAMALLLCLIIPEAPRLFWRIYGLGY
jgi:prepilin signal peptidase PulO-like enzyme (type II secretory pathway)